MIAPGRYLRKLPSSAILVAALAAIHTERTLAQYARHTAVTIDKSLGDVEWAGLDEAGRHLFQSEAKADGEVGREFAVAPQDLVVWGSPPMPGRGVFVVLVDSSVVAVETVGADAESLQITSATTGGRALPLTQVRGIVFPAAGAPGRRDRVFGAVAAARSGDRDKVMTLGDDELTGTIKSIDFQNVMMETSLGPVVVELTKTVAITFNPALAARPAESGLRTIVGLRDGSILCSTSIEEDQDAVRFKLAAGGDDAAPAWEVGRSEIVYLQTIGGQATYLSDLEPTGYRHVPYLERGWDYALDRSVGGATLLAGGRRYRKGIGMHSTSRLTFPIAADRKRFAAEIAIDDETQGRGSVTFRVFVDAEERFRSDVVRGGDPPRPIEVDVSGGGQLSLVVDFADFADEQDHADWLNARLMP